VKGKGAIKWTRLSCRSFAANPVRLQLHAPAYNLGNFMRTLAMPKAAKPWSMTSLRATLIKIFGQGVDGSDSSLTQDRLELGEELFDGIEIWTS
jgi:DDE family transposase